MPGERGCAGWATASHSRSVEFGSTETHSVFFHVHRLVVAARKGRLCMLPFLDLLSPSFDDDEVTSQPLYLVFSYTECLPVPSTTLYIFVFV